MQHQEYRNYYLYDHVTPAEDYKKKKHQIVIFTIWFFQSWPGYQRSISTVFHEKNLQKISECDRWYAEGTFSCASSIFTQLYTIHGIQS